jgi:hypothetical protein
MVLATTQVAAQTIVVGPPPDLSVVPGGQVEVLIEVDMSGAEGLDIASLQFELSWDAALLAYVSASGSAPSDWTVILNEDLSGSGELGVGLFSATGETESFVAVTVVFQAADVQGQWCCLNVSVSAAGDELGSNLLSFVNERDVPICIGVTGILGDVTDDGVVNIIDAQQLARYSIGLPTPNAPNIEDVCDANEDGACNIIDAQQTARYAVGLPTPNAPNIGAVLPGCEGPLPQCEGTQQNLVITTNELEPARQTLPYGTTLSASGGTGAGYAWSISGGVLPAGITLQVDGSLSGTPTVFGSFSFGVRVEDSGGNEATRELILTVCDPPVALAVGEYAVRSFPAECGVVLPSVVGARYEVGLIARAYEQTGATAVPVAGDLMLRATAGAPTTGWPVAEYRPQLVRQAYLSEEALDPEIRRLVEATERLHTRLRQEEIRDYPGAAPTPLGPPLPPAARSEALSQAPPVNRTFEISDPSGGTAVIPATLRRDGTNLIYYQDDNVVGTDDEATDAEIDRLIDYYDAYGKAIIDNTFGGLGPPGTTDNFVGGPRPADDIDGNGKFIVLQLSRSLMPGGAAAYVSACDRVPRPENYNAGGFSCDRSNEAEMTYILRPQSAFYLGALVHEVKHISSHGYAIFAGRGFNPSWIEEGTAEIAKEKSSRDAAGLADGFRVGFADVYPGGSPTDATTGMDVVHSRARFFLKASPLSALVGNPDPNPQRSTYYGASWLFHRFLSDNYGAADENVLFYNLNTGGVDIEQIVSVTGADFPRLLSEFLVAIALEGHQAVDSAAIRFLSYDFADIAGYSSGTWPYVQSSGPYSTFDQILSTYYTSPNFFEFLAEGNALLRIDALDGQAQAVLADHDVALSVVRVQ